VNAVSDLVSILIPAYNAEKWIKETIKSASEQTWPNKEIIIVDDGSSDNTFRIAREFESPSVKVITQGNKGASAARNKALSLAQGDYIQWLDADDLLAPNKIFQQLKGDDRSRNSRILLSSSFGKFYFRIQKAKFNPNELWQDLEPIDYFLKKFGGNAWIANSAWLVSRRLTEFAGPWNENLSLNDDGEYFCRVAAVCEKIKFIKEAKSYYRQANIRSLSKNTSNKARISFYLSVKLSISHLRSLEDSERTIAACTKYLERWLYHFYPEKPSISPKGDEFLCEIVHKVNSLANELGLDLAGRWSCMS
jgi:glycosyltransferase involved in cell wall biosynthesis